MLEQTCSSLPFGDRLSCTVSTITPTEHHFTGKERDTESGNDYFGARYYASAMGRFLSPDWASDPTAVPYATYANPQTLNLYNYMRNNPLGGVDPDGHCGGPDDPCSDNLSVGQVTNIVFNETQSLSGNDVTVSDAHIDVAHAIINGDNDKGDNRPETASDKVSAANQKTGTYQSTLTDVQGACKDAANGIDPTNGAENFNLRPNDSTAPFQGSDIQTQSGPLNNSYPSAALPKGKSVYVNTYKAPPLPAKKPSTHPKPPAPKPKPTPPPPPPPKKQPGQ
ncbi:MAG: RHS repeat-associated core domain-containing protein [Terracidiphilus sp.]